MIKRTLIVFAIVAGMIFVPPFIGGYFFGGRDSFGIPDYNKEQQYVIGFFLLILSYFLGWLIYKYIKGDFK